MAEIANEINSDMLRCHMSVLRLEIFPSRLKRLSRGLSMRPRFRARRRNDRGAASGRTSDKSRLFVISGYINGISGSRLVDLPIFW